jgi:ABC-2 type transport system permease protein
MRNRARRREAGDGRRAVAFAAMGLLVTGVLFAAFFWLTWQVLGYEELGTHLIRMGLSWLFLTFLSFVAFSAIVTCLASFFLADDLRLLLCAPVSTARLFYARLTKATVQASWMVVAFVVPALLGIGLASCATWRFYASVVLGVVPFVLIPSALGSLVGLTLVNVFPARRVRDLLVLTGLVFAVSLVVLLRMVQPERLLTVESLPDITSFFTGLQAPVTPLLPSFWVSEVIFAGFMNRFDWFHLAALWASAFGLAVTSRIAHDRFYFSGWSKAQESRKARFSKLRVIETVVGWLPLLPAGRAVAVKDVKVFFRDTAQWSQLLLILALVVVYIFNFRVLDLSRVPWMAGFIRNVYAFLNMALASLVLSAVAARFVFPALSTEGPAFWILRKSPLPLRHVLLTKFWISVVPIVVLIETLTIVSNRFLGVAPFLEWVAVGGLFFLSLALVGLALGLGARYPRFSAESSAQIATSYGAVVFMVQAVLLTLVQIGLLAWPSSVYLWHHTRQIGFDGWDWTVMAGCLLAVVALDLGVMLHGLRTGERALALLDD